LSRSILLLKILKLALELDCRNIRRPHWARLAAPYRETWLTRCRSHMRETQEALVIVAIDFYYWKIGVTLSALPTGECIKRFS